MTWVVKRWRIEGLERLLSQEALASAQAARAAADRDARRVRRVAERAAADAAAELDALERLATELRATVGRRRAADAGAPAWERAAPSVAGPARLSAAAAAVAAAARAASDPGVGDPPADPLGALSAPPPRRRSGRASMRSSALGELFRATTAP
jgi:hypothetical protein